MLEANEINSTFYALRLLSHGLDTSQVEVTEGEEYPASEFTKEEQEKALEIIHTIADSESVPIAQLSSDQIGFYLTSLADRIERLAQRDLANAGYAVSAPPEIDNIQALGSARARNATASLRWVTSDFDEIPVSGVTPAIAGYLNSVDPYKRAAAVGELGRSRQQDAFSLISTCFDDESPHVRNAAARALREIELAQTVDLFNRALEEASHERRRNIGRAIAASGLATEAINNLVSESRKDTYDALSLLFVMAKTGEIDPLVRALEEHANDEVGKAVAKLLTLSGHQTESEARSSS
jgi:HEAT repeat protein